VSSRWRTTESSWPRTRRACSTPRACRRSTSHRRRDAAARGDGGRGRPCGRRRLAHPARRRVDGGGGRARRSREISSRPCCSVPWERAEWAALDVLRRAGRPVGPRLQPRARRAPADRSPTC
jgi:hypothetical protein